MNKGFVLSAIKKGESSLTMQISSIDKVLISYHVTKQHENYSHEKIVEIEITPKLFNMKYQWKNESKQFPDEFLKFEYSYNFKNIKIYNEERIKELLSLENVSIRDAKDYAFGIIDDYYSYFEPPSRDNELLSVDEKLLIEWIYNLLDEIRDILIDGEEKGYIFEVR